MLRFLIRRVLLLLFVVWGISLVTFVLARLVPSDPARLIGGPLSGDLGRSFSSKRPVADDLRAFLPATIELGTAALLLALLVGVPVGIIAAVRRNSGVDYAGRGLAILGLSLPPFWIGLMAQLVFYSGLTLLPVGGRLSQDVAAPA